MNRVPVYKVLVEKGYFLTEEEALRAIELGQIRINGDILHKDQVTQSTLEYFLLSGHRYRLEIKNTSGKFKLQKEIRLL